MSETLELRWIKPTEKMPAMGQQVLVLWRGICASLEVSPALLSTVDEFSLCWMIENGTVTACGGSRVIGWWPIPNADELD